MNITLKAKVHMPVKLTTDSHPNFIYTLEIFTEIIIVSCQKKLIF